MNLDEQQGPLAIRVSLYFLLQFYTPADSLVFLREHGHGNSCVGYSWKRGKKKQEMEKFYFSPHAAAEWTWGLLTMARPFLCGKEKETRQPQVDIS
jgi:hypothetical protein